MSLKLAQFVLLNVLKLDSSLLASLPLLSLWWEGLHTWRWGEERNQGCTIWEGRSVFVCSPGCGFLPPAPGLPHMASIKYSSSCSVYIPFTHFLPNCLHHRCGSNSWPFYKDFLSCNLAPSFFTAHCPLQSHTKTTPFMCPSTLHQLLQLLPPTCSCFASSRLQHGLFLGHASF